MQERVRVLEERIHSQEDMLERTTDYMSNIQQKLAASKKLVVEKNEQITDSLRYAKRLQQSLHPDEERLRQHFSGAFIHLKETDLIGGDLAYSRLTDEGYYIAAIDCTGHGIPGAMLSMMAYSYLDEIILHLNFSNPDDILSKLNEMMYHSLRSKSEDIKDGLDIALCRICKDKKELCFAGARRPLVYIPNDKIEVFDATRVSIGETPDASFEQHQIDLAQGQKIYLFSDGMTDQFGGPKNKKFGKKRLLNLLGAIKDLHMTKQYEIITNTLASWQGSHEQTDDQVMIGIKI